MATLVRTWLGLAAMGAGLIHLAVAAAAPPALLATFAGLGAAEVAWGIAALARWTVPLPRTALAGAMLPTLVWVGLLLAGAGSSHGDGHAAGLHPMAAGSTLGTDLPVGPMLGATLLDLALAVVVALRLRRGRPEERGAEPGVWAYLGGVVGGAGVIFALTSAALGGTAIGASAMHAMGH
jgi:hypothetical protein